MATQRTRKAKLSDGIIKQNPVLMSGLFAVPVIGAATSWETALAVCYMFSVITPISVGLCRLLPKKIAFAIRIVLYALIASLVYVPAVLTARLIFPVGLTEGISLYLAVIVTNPLILTKTESRFFLRTPFQMFKDMFGFVIGFDLACLLVGVIRDVLADNIVGHVIVPLSFQMPSMNTVSGGFIMVGVLAGLFRALYNKFGKKKVKRKF
ncbi:MAG: hypothetical protein J1F60_09640 [Oscillospiraceae bacterium]|nr:hypothetical protein [Oscillospiraceae bacterium]